MALVLWAASLQVAEMLVGVVAAVDSARGVMTLTAVRPAGGEVTLTAVQPSIVGIPCTI